MATLYLRKNRWWLSWFVGGERFAKSTGYLVHEKEDALAAKAQLERELQARRALIIPERAQRVFAGYRKQWVENRKAQGKASAKDDEARLRHCRELDPLLMSEVRPKHIRAVILRLRREDELAPRSIRNVFGVLHRLFQDAIVDELVVGNPCVLPEGDLPGKVDKDPAWRAQAVFTRAEVNQLLCDARIPEDRRVRYALFFLSGMRVGEVSALRWSCFAPDMEPLGRLLVSSSFDRRTKKVKGVKVEGRTREVPVHPTLARILADWKLGGWARTFGKKPKAEDLLMPSTAAASFGEHLRNVDALYAFHADLKTLGLRQRRLHDARRTFISLALADGARADVLKWVTHGPPGDIISLYTTLPWPALCAEVAKLNVRAEVAATISLRGKTSERKAK